MKSFSPALLLLASLAVLATGCREQRDEAFSSPSSKTNDPQSEAFKKDLAELTKVRMAEVLKQANGGLETDKSADISAEYQSALQRLIKRGSAIESPLIETLLSHDDWGVRLGVVEVMQAVGTKRSVGPLIQVLDDLQPLVALQAEHALQDMTKHREIPEAGQAIKANGLPPVPLRDPKEPDLDSEQRIWAAWHAQYKIALRKSWSDWWEKNKSSVKVD